MSEPAATQAAILDVKTADFLPQQGNVPPATAQQCRRQCAANDTLSKRAESKEVPPSDRTFFQGGIL
jgi:hypothetical protein